MKLLGIRIRLPFEGHPFAWTLRLVVLNTAIFFAMALLEQALPVVRHMVSLGRGNDVLLAENWLHYQAALHPKAVLHGKIWQLFTYMFLHGDLMHLLFNMLALFMFGRAVEQAMGPAVFLRFYFVSGLVAGVVSLIPFLATGNSIPIVGASGAVLGVLAVFGLIFPNATILFFFVLPIQARYFVWIIAAIDLYGAIQGTGNIAHLAHIGGLLTGIVLFKSGWYRSSYLSFSDMKRKREVSRRQRERELVNEILDKVSSQGIHSLTKTEREFLEKMRKHH